jgi:hypothetical protein
MTPTAMRMITYRSRGHPTGQDTSPARYEAQPRIGTRAVDLLGAAPNIQVMQVMQVLQDAGRATRNRIVTSSLVNPTLYWC